MTEFTSLAKEAHFSFDEIPDRIENAVKEELLNEYSQLTDKPFLTDVISDLVKIRKTRVIFIIDEWDAPIRENNSYTTEEKYLSFLRRLFKNNTFTSECVAAAYMTGILPIKKIKSQSAISDFREYTALAPGKFAEYIGFNENDIRLICNKYGLDFEKMKQWYDGYTFGSAADIYNPYSVMCAADLKQYGSYRKKTSAAGSLAEYLDMNFEGLQDEIIRLIRGEEIMVDTDDFQNDFTTFTSKDDVLTLLIHLGYLTYCGETRLARIPNEELRSVIKLAYLAAVDHYIKIEELPSGKGLADIVYLPQRGSPYPALIIELKWNKSDESAIEQIKQKNYPAVLRNYGGEILLVGINYDLKEKNHQCRIERAEL